MRLTKLGSTRQISYRALVVLILTIIVSGACKRRTAATVPTPPVPEPPKPAAPTVSISVEPATIQRGQSATIKWSSTNATDLDLQPAFGRVEKQGSVSVTPNDSLTYTLTGRGPGGSSTATARLTVTAPPPAPVAPKPEVTTTLRERYERDVQDAFFDYDQSDLRDDGRSALLKSALFLKENSAVTVQIEGHCDERGSVAYNLGLGDRRANSARDFLIQQGISGDRISTISYGKEKPFCTEANESCYQENRRAHLVCTNCGM